MHVQYEVKIHLIQVVILSRSVVFSRFFVVFVFIFKPGFDEKQCMLSLLRVPCGVIIIKGNIGVSSSCLVRCTVIKSYLWCKGLRTHFESGIACRYVVPVGWNNS